MAKSTPARHPQQNGKWNEGAANIDTTLPYSSVKGALFIFDPKARSREMSNGNDAESRRSRNVSPNVSPASANNGNQVKEFTLANATNTLDCGRLVVEHEVDLKLAKEQQVALLAELDSVKREMKRMQQELLSEHKEKEEAIRHAEEANAAADFNAKRVEELSNEIVGANESLELVKLACVEANRDRAALLAATRPEGGDLEQLKLETAFKELQEELDLTKKELARMSDREADARATSAILTTELERARAELRVAQGKASEANMGLSQILQQKTDEAHETEAMKEEAWKAAIDPEQVKVELQAILQEAKGVTSTCGGQGIVPEKAILMQTLVQDVKVLTLNAKRLDSDESLQSLNKNKDTVQGSKVEDLLSTDTAVELKRAASESKGGRFNATTNMATVISDRQSSFSEARQPKLLARVLSSKMDKNLAEGEPIQKLKKNKKQLLIGSVIGFLGKGKKAP